MFRKSTNFYLSLSTECKDGVECDVIRSVD
jgi:hypothetical protein